MVINAISGQQGTYQSPDTGVQPAGSTTPPAIDSTVELMAANILPVSIQPGTDTRAERSYGDPAISDQKTSSDQFIADTSLVRPWDGKGAGPEPPNVVRFQRGDNELSYVAVRHETDLNSKTFETIKKEFSEFKPQIVIIEGLQTSEGISPASRTNNPPLDSKTWPRGEPQYSAALASQNGVPFIGGEPDDRAYTDNFRGKGYTDKDIMGFLLARQIPGRSKEAGSKPFDLGEFYKADQDNLAKKFSLDENAKFASPDDFKKWYKEKNNIDLVTGPESASIVAPRDGPNALFTQKMSLEGDKLRDANITSVIASKLNEYDRVMVVYGAGHLFQERLVLEKMFRNEQR